jgi:HEAT repeat protein
MMATQENVQPEQSISSLIADLDNADGIQRQKSRNTLISMGSEVVPALIDVVVNGKGHPRWEAIEALGFIGDPAAASILVDALMDDDVGIRWAASGALVRLGRPSLEPLLVALTKDFDSVWLRQGAHHILHTFKDQGMLFPEEIKVYDATQGVEPLVEIPWAADAALRNLKSRS